MLAEQRMLMEEEKQAAVIELRQQLQVEKDREIAETKRKQWVDIFVIIYLPFPTLATTFCVSRICRTTKLKLLKR